MCALFSSEAALRFPHSTWITWVQFLALTFDFSVFFFFSPKTLLFFLMIQSYTEERQTPSAGLLPRCQQWLQPGQCELLSRVGAEAQGLGASFTAFLGIPAASWTGGRTVRTRTDAHRECWPHRQRLNVRYHGASPYQLLPTVSPGSSRQK